jgi:arginine decarboxylase
VPLARAAGRIAAEAITPYPPGIPLVMPGERLDDDVVGLLAVLRVDGNPISASDPTMELVKVVR